LFRRFRSCALQQEIWTCGAVEARFNAVVHLPHCTKLRSRFNIEVLPGAMKRAKGTRFSALMLLKRHVNSVQ
jgi:hypothetical protein